MVSTGSRPSEDLAKFVGLRLCFAEPSKETNLLTPAGAALSLRERVPKAG